MFSTMTWSSLHVKGSSQQQIRAQSHLTCIQWYVLAHNLAVDWAGISSSVPQHLHLHCHFHHIQTSNICHNKFLYLSRYQTKAPKMWLLGLSWIPFHLINNTKLEATFFPTSHHLVISKAYQKIMKLALSTKKT